MNIRSVVLASLAVLTATLPVSSAQSVQDTIYQDKAAISGKDGFDQNRVIFRAAHGQKVIVTLPCTPAGCKVAFSVKGWVPMVDNHGRPTLRAINAQAGVYEVTAPELVIGRRIAHSPTTVVAAIERQGTLMATNKVRVSSWGPGGKWAWVEANFTGIVNYQHLSKAHRPAGT